MLECPRELRDPRDPRDPPTGGPEPRMAEWPPKRSTTLEGEMPELPEVEITARLIGAATEKAEIESALAPGINALKTYDPPLTALAGKHLTGIGRRGKLLLVEVEDEFTAVIHLMSAGRLQLFDSRGSLRDRTSRFLVRLGDGRELRLR